MIYSLYASWSGALLRISICSKDDPDKPPACFNSIGEYSTFMIVPNYSSKTDWRIKAAWSGMVIPKIQDNVSAQEKKSWSRYKDFPMVIWFRNEES